MKLSKIFLYITLSLTIALNQYIYGLSLVPKPTKSLELRLFEAELVIVGKLKLNKNSNKGSIVIEQILKGNKKLKTIKINVIKSKYGIRDKPDGTKGIWVIKGKNNKGEYTVSFLYDTQSYYRHSKNIETRVKRTLSAISNLKWSKPVKGLSIATLVYSENQSAKPRDNCWHLMLLVKNTSKKTLLLTNYPGKKPLAIKIIDPKGKEKTIDLYSYVDKQIKSNVLTKANKKNIQKLKAGEQTIFLSFKKGMNLRNCSDVGKFKISATYSYGIFEAKGNGLKIDGALVKGFWEGEVTATSIFGNEPYKPLENVKTFLARHKKEKGVITTKSGLQYKILKAGKKDGKKPKATDIVKVRRKIIFTNGKLLGDAGGAVNRAILNNTTKGWLEAMLLMKEGAKYKFVIPPHLAYGERGEPRISIPGNAILIYIIELVEVE